MGFALQIIENLDGIKDTVKHADMMDDVCNSWTDFASQYGVTTSNSYESGV